MTRRNRKRYSNRNQAKKNNNNCLNKMLNLSKLSYFRYDAKDIFHSLNLDEKVWVPLLASIVSKASRQGIKEAKEYLMQKEREEILTEDAVKALSRLLDKYKKWR